MTRVQFAPCAKAMAGHLERIYSQTSIVMDKSRSRADRMEARRVCLAESSALSRLMREAGGPAKLFRMGWDDTRLNRFNIDVETARSTYFLYCYYGQADLPFGGMESSHVAARSLAAELR